MEFAVQPIHQGKTNGCGTAALAMVLNVLFGDSGPRLTQAMLDRGHRELDSFCSPGMLIEISRKHGANGALYNHATLAEICAHLDAEHPVLALHSVDGKLSGLHYVLIAGYYPDEPLGDTTLICWDPAMGQRKIIPYQDFRHRFWPPLRVAGLDTGLDCPILVVSRHPDLPPDRAVPWLLRLALPVNRLINTVAAFIP